MIRINYEKFILRDIFKLIFKKITKKIIQKSQTKDRNKIPVIQRVTKTEIFEDNRG